MTRLRLPAAAALATVLATVSLGAAFLNTSWVWPTLLPVLVVVVACEGARRLGVPRALVPVVGLVALVACLVGQYAGSSLSYGVVPGVETVRLLAELVAEGRTDINQYAAPIAVLPGLLLLTGAGIGAVALAVDTLAVTLRRPALAGLPLLAVYSVPAAVVPGGVSWLAFALGAAGYLALLLVEAHDKVGRWGRPLGSSGFGRRLTPTGLTAAGRRVGVAAIACAVAVPVAVPGLDDGVLGNGSGGVGNGRGTGNRTVAVVNPVLNLQDDLVRPENRELLTYTTTDPSPGYLRIVGLDDFDGRRWDPRRLQVPQSQSVDRGLDEPAGLTGQVGREQVESQLRIGDFETRWLPLPYPAAQVDIDGTWLYDKDTFNVFSTSSSTRRQSYRVQHLDVAPTRQQLQAAPRASDPQFERFLALPPLPPDILATATRVTAGARTQYDQALALQTWLRESGGFSYDERAPDGMGLDAISAFLQSKRGFCVHFASAMTVMARELGIPARVGVGVLPGRQVEPGRYSVSSRDMHAWPELFFDGVGWVTFEPTPASRTGLAPAYARPDPAALPDTGASGDSTSTAPDESTTDPGAPASERQLDRDPDRTADLDGGGVAGSTDTGTAVPWRPVGAGALALLFLLSPATARVLMRRWRWRAARRAGGFAAAAEAAWAEVRAAGADYGHGSPSSETPRQLAHRLAVRGRLPEPARAALQRLTAAVERARYARAPGPAGERDGGPVAGVAGDLSRDVAAVRAGLAGSASRGSRVRAGLLPRSTAALLHAAGERIADVLDSADRFAASVRRRGPKAAR